MTEFIQGIRPPENYFSPIVARNAVIYNKRNLFHKEKIMFCSQDIIKNRKVTCSNPTRPSAGLKDPTSLRGSR